MDGAGSSFGAVDDRTQPAQSPIIEQVSRIQDVRSGLEDTLSTLRNISDALGLPELPLAGAEKSQTAANSPTGHLWQLRGAVDELQMVAGYLYSATQRLNQVV